MTLLDDGVHHQMGSPDDDECRCTNCGNRYPLFLADWVFQAYASRPNAGEHICRACELDARGQRKQRDPWEVKAQNAIANHAGRLGIDRSVLVDVFGWELKLLAKDAVHEFVKGWCNYCGEQYAGPADVTLDIQDRDRDPFYRTNTRWCCQACNRGKGAMTPEQFEKERLMWKLWKRSKKQPGEPWTLF